MAFNPQVRGVKKTKLFEEWRNECVIIKDLGTFTLSSWSLETGIRRELKHSKPIFLISHSLEEDYWIYQMKHYENNKIPVAVLNYCDLACKCNSTKETVISCIDEVVQCVRRMCYENRNLVLEMPNLGVLTIKNGELDFVFTNDCHPNIVKKNPPCYRAKSSMTPYVPNKKIPCDVHAKKEF